MSFVEDALGQRHDADRERHRMVSLVPSTTETVFRLGAEQKLVGVTRYCVRPGDAHKRRAVVGGTKSVRIDDVLALEPDLVLANQEENSRSDIERLMDSVPVFLFYPRVVDDAVRDIRVLGTLCRRTEQAEVIATTIERATEELEPFGTFRFLYLIWRNPFMVAGRGTFVDALLSKAGGINAALGDDPYPSMTEEQIVDAAPDVLLLSSEPFPFAETHAAELRDATRVPTRLVDGQLLSWHGARLSEGVPYAGELATSIVRDRAR